MSKPSCQRLTEALHELVLRLFCAARFGRDSAARAPQTRRLVRFVTRRVSQFKAAVIAVVTGSSGVSS